MEKKTTGKLCQFLIFVALTYLTPHVSAKTSNRMFTVEKGGTGGRVHRLGQGTTEPDVISCTRSCLQQYQDCMSVMYNSNTGLCTPGSMLNQSGTPPTEEEGTLYVTRCDLNKGFSIYRSDGHEACMKYVTDTILYTEADAACMNMGAFMASVKTMTKLNIIIQQLFGGKFPGQQFWVGCDDLDQHGLYVWKEDGETFTVETKPATFLEPNEPQGGNEHCIVMKLNFLLNDYPCTDIFTYICEQSLQ